LGGSIDVVGSGARGGAAGGNDASCDRCVAAGAAFDAGADAAPGRALAVGDGASAGRGAGDGSAAGCSADAGAGADAGAAAGGCGSDFEQAAVAMSVAATMIPVFHDIMAAHLSHVRQPS